MEECVRFSESVATRRENARCWRWRAVEGEGIYTREARTGANGAKARPTRVKREGTVKLWRTSIHSDTNIHISACERVCVATSISEKVANGKAATSSRGIGLSGLDSSQKTCFLGSISLYHHERTIHFHPVAFSSLPYTCTFLPRVQNHSKSLYRTSHALHILRLNRSRNSKEKIL